MGRKGSKRRGRREAGGAAAVGSPPAKQTKLVPDGGDGDRRASSGRGGESLKAMPWTRWTGGELHNAKAEHQALANWKRGSFPSAAFEAYYRRQLSSHAPRGLLPEVEWPAFLSALRRPLPATFRLNPAHPAGATLLRRLRDGEFDLPPASTQQVHPTGVPIPPSRFVFKRATPLGRSSSLPNTPTPSPAVVHLPQALCPPHASPSQPWMRPPIAHAASPHPFPLSSTSPFSSKCYHHLRHWPPLAEPSLVPIRRAV